MIRAPEFIVFTGADNDTSVTEMAALSRDFPIEWGILLHPEWQGKDPRYPGVAALQRFAASGLRLAAHLCGGYSDAIMLLDARVPLDLAVCTRMQINHPRPDAAAIARFSGHWGKRCIAQCRGEVFPGDSSIDWLFDESAGHGIVPAHWPPHPGRLVGYAGGIGPGNVGDVLRRIAATGPYWIDMETGVRGSNRFDLALCRRVCDLVYGVRQQAAGDV